MRKYKGRVAAAAAARQLETNESLSFSRSRVCVPFHQGAITSFVLPRRGRVSALGSLETRRRRRQGTFDRKILETRVRAVAAAALTRSPRFFRSPAREFKCVCVCMCATWPTAEESLMCKVVDFSGLEFSAGLRDNGHNYVI